MAWKLIRQIHETSQKLLARGMGPLPSQYGPTSGVLALQGENLFFIFRVRLRNYEKIYGSDGRVADFLAMSLTSRSKNLSH